MYELYHGGLVPIVHWLGELIDKLVPWPAIVVFALLYAPTRDAISRFARGISDMLTMIRTVKAAGVELSLDPDSARRVAGSSTEIVVSSFKAAADDACRQAAIWSKFEQVIDSVIVPELKKIHGDSIPHIRSTIHILDDVYVETTYQLVEYLYRPDDKTRKIERPSTRGRRLSIRFGIIGRAWRLGASDYDPDVTTDSSELIRKWGMTHEEAKMAGRGRKSFAVFLMRNSEQHPLACVYIDAETEKLFGSAPFADLNEKFLKAAESKGMVAALVQITTTLASAYSQPIKKLS